MDTHRNTLHCNTLQQHTASHCNTLQYTATQLQHAATSKPLVHVDSGGQNKNAANKNAANKNAAFFKNKNAVP